MIFSNLIVKSEWIDVYGHMNMACYAKLFDEVGFRFLDQLDLGIAYSRQESCGLFTIEALIKYLKELKEGNEIEVRVKIKDFDDVRFDTSFELVDLQTGKIAATMQQKAVHASLITRKTTAFSKNKMNSIRAFIDQSS